MVYRIKEYDEGFVVEIQKRKWYGKKYWALFIANGNGSPWYYPTSDQAGEGLINKIRWSVILE